MIYFIYLHPFWFIGLLLLIIISVPLLAYGLYWLTFSIVFKLMFRDETRVPRAAVKQNYYE
jgi:hypothetical protein